MTVLDIKAFIPSKDYENSKAFYSEIGFEPTYVTDDLTLFENGDCSIFVQRFYNESLAQNFMIQICVTDILKVYELCSASAYKQKTSEIAHESWGQVFYLWGPSGELLHITQLAEK